MNTREGKKPRRRSALQRTAVKLATGALNAVGVPIDLARTGRAFGVEGIGNWDPTSAEFLGAAIPAINGIFSAPDLARMYAALSLGGEIDGVRLLSERTLREASRVREPGPDAVLVMPMNWSLGYHSVITRTGPSKTGFGHLGLCGTGGWADMKKRLAMGMTANWTFQGPREQYTSFALTLAALGCARKGGARHAT